MQSSDDARGLVTSRVFDAPLPRVYEAFADPKQMVSWWGPTGFRNTMQRFDLVPGGAFELVMHGPDGVDYHNHKRFVEVVPQQRVVYDHFGPMHAFRMVMQWEAVPEGTRLTWHMQFAEPLEPAMRDFLVIAGEQNFDRLAAHLATSASGDRGL